MQKNLECPICEHLLTVDAAHSAPTHCPGCGQNVDWVPVSAPEISKPVESLQIKSDPLRPGIPPAGPGTVQRSTRSLTPPPPIKTRAKQPPSTVASTPDEIQIPDADVDNRSSATEKNANQKNSNETKPVVNATKSDNAIPIPIMVTLVVAAVGSLIAILYMVLASQTGASHASEDRDSDRLSQKAGRNASPTKTPTVDPRDKLSPDEIPSRTTLEKLEQIWPRVRTYLVALSVETDHGTQYASGVVVDSRGWIATSSRMLQGAKKVTVTWPNQDFIEGKPFSSRTDESIGIVAQNKDLDIVIIAVGRDSIVELTDVAYGDPSSVVASQTLIAGSQPAEDRRLWLKDCRVSQRSRFDELHPAFRSNLARESSDPIDSSLRFLTHSGTVSPRIAGGPLFDEEGRLVAINTMLAFSNETLAVPVSAISKLKASATGQLMAFDTRSADGAQVSAMAADAANSSGDQSTQRSMPEFNEIANAHDALDEAMRLGCVAQTAMQYETLKGLAAALADVDTLRKSLIDNPEKLKSLDHHIDDLNAKLMGELNRSGELTQEAATKVNQLFQQQRIPGSEDYFVAYASVKHPTMLSSEIEGNSTITFETVGNSELIVSVATKENADSLTIGTKGMLIGKLRPERFILSEDGVEKETVFCEALYFFEVQEF
jgi:S1-C subfamily serine protease